MKCKACDGTGTSNWCVNGTFKTCEVCDGKGEVNTMDKNFQKNIAYNVLQLTVKARNDLLYAHQVIGETYTMKEDYKMPFNTHNDLYHANETCAKNALPALNEIVAHTASLYVRCCEDLARREQKEAESDANG